MPISGIRPNDAIAQLRPFRQGGGDFAASLRSQIHSQVVGEISRALSGAGQPKVGAPHGGTSQPSLQYRSVNLNTTGPWADLARSIGGQYLSPQVADVFTRQMALESGNFDPAVIDGTRVSPAGAEGIAQLMPSSYPNVNRRDPVASLQAAASKMSTNLQLFGGDLRKALAAYNAGAGAVGALVARLGPAWETGLQPETQTYLRSLLGSASS
jgi:soluble lytic murein transglycosylase-like protein